MLVLAACSSSKPTVKETNKTQHETPIVVESNNEETPTTTEVTKTETEAIKEVIIESDIIETLEENEVEVEEFES